MYFSSSGVRAGLGGMEARWSAGGVGRLVVASRPRVKSATPSRTRRAAATAEILAAGDDQLREGPRSGEEPWGPRDLWGGVASLRPIGYFASLRLRIRSNTRARQGRGQPWPLNAR